MTILFIRIIVMYLLVFAVIRLSGKRQLSQLQPFDLVITLLIADLASMPMEDPSIPLSYGVVPILSLFLMQKLIAYIALKSRRLRKIACGSPLLIINKGRVEENIMRQANYSFEDLQEQLRTMGIFDIADVNYAILETNGTLSVLRFADKETVTCEDMKIRKENIGLSYSLIIDGEIIDTALTQSGKSRAWIEKQLEHMGIIDVKQVFYAQLKSDGVLTAQLKDEYGAKIISSEEKEK